MRRLLRARDGGRDARRRPSHVVLLHEHAVEEPEAVVHRSAGEDRVLLEHAQPGRGLPGVEDVDAGPFDRLHEGAGHGGDPGEVLEEIERHALGGENGARGSLERGERRVERDRASIGARPRDLHLRIQLAEGQHGDAAPGEDPLAPRLDVGPGAGRRINDGVGGRVPAPDVLRQSQAHHGQRDRFEPHASSPFPLRASARPAGRGRRRPARTPPVMPHRASRARAPPSALRVEIEARAGSSSSTLGAVAASATDVVRMTSSTDFTMVVGVIPCSAL